MAPPMRVHDGPWGSKIAATAGAGGRPSMDRDVGDRTNLKSESAKNDRRGRMLESPFAFMRGSAVALRTVGGILEQEQTAKVETPT